MAYESYDIQAVEGIESLQSRMENADTVRDWSFILKDYIQSGNNKISKTTAIFNMNSAHDCPNRESENCQVPWEDCYAGKAERIYPQSLPYRRRQEYLWDCMTPELWAKAFETLNSRKRKPFTSIRFSEAGDFRHDADIIRVDRIAELLDVPVYTYSASDYIGIWRPKIHGLTTGFGPAGRHCVVPILPATSRWTPCRRTAKVWRLSTLYQQTGSERGRRVALNGHD